VCGNTRESCGETPIKRVETSSSVWKHHQACGNSVWKPSSVGKHSSSRVETLVSRVETLVSRVETLVSRVETPIKRGEAWGRTEACGTLGTRGRGTWGVGGGLGTYRIGAYKM
jgi:hypothetical protein